MEAVVIHPAGSFAFNVFVGDTFLTQDRVEMVIKEFLDHNTFPILAQEVKKHGDEAHPSIKTYDKMGRVSKLNTSPWDMDPTSFSAPVQINTRKLVMDQDMSDGFDVMKFIKDLNE